MLTLDAIKVAADRPTKSIPVPEWGGDVVCKTLSGADLDRLDRECYDDKGNIVLDKYRATFVALCIFDGVTAEHVETLQGKSGPVLQKLYVECKAFNQLHGVEGAAKN